MTKISKSSLIRHREVIARTEVVMTAGRGFRREAKKYWIGKVMNMDSKYLKRV